MAALPQDQEYLEGILAHAIASAFEGCGEAWLDDTSGDRLAAVAARAVSRQLIEAGVKIRGVDAEDALTARRHRLVAEGLLGEASFQSAPGGQPVLRDGTGVSFEHLQLLVAKAQVHALLAALPSSQEDER